MGAANNVTLGIDFSADVAKTIACEVDWTEHHVRFHKKVDDQRIRSWAEGREHNTIAIDVPFGWPERFLKVTARHRLLSRAEIKIGSYETISEQLRYRKTDEFVRSETGRTPLSVSASFLGCAALRFALIQADLSLDGYGIDRTGLSGKFVEVYPAAALDIWWSKTPVKRDKEEYARKIFKWLEEKLGGSLRSAIRRAAQKEALESSDDAADALICALMARAVQLSRPPENRRLVRCPDEYWDKHPGTKEATEREGWIWLPAGRLDPAKLLG